MTQATLSAFTRQSGVLVHLTSLPGRFGCGDMGKEAYDFIDFLKKAQQRIWQILPLTPTGYGNCPYSSSSAFAGNHYLISPEKLLERNLLDAIDLENPPPFPCDHVDFGWSIDYRMKLLHTAFTHFKTRFSGHTKRKQDYKKFCEANHAWLEGYALFMALKQKYNGSHWREWSHEDQVCDAKTQKRYATELADAINLHKFLQFEFSEQWHALRAYANSQQVQIVGDIPIFVGYDSADVWATKEAFQLDADFNPTVVAGCPPDAFATTGQRWGNPHYNWSFMQASNFAWWTARFKKQFELYDIIRIDHFRGFAAYWEIPASAPTAEECYGAKWVYGYGNELFAALKQAGAEAKIIAEDLGTITPDVEELRKNNGLPGMKILQFGFESCDAGNSFLPANFEPDCVVYTGTHDNDTTLGWYRATPDYIKTFLHQSIHANNEVDVVWEMMRLGMESCAVLCITPLQDILAYGSEARMNFPGVADNQWEFRYRAESLTDAHAARLGALTQQSHRLG